MKMKKKLLLPLLVLPAMLGGVSASAVKPAEPAIRVKRANSVYAQQIIDHIKDAVAAHPSEYYATGEDLALFYNQMESLLASLNLTSGLVATVNGQIDLLADEINKKAGDYSALILSAVEAISESLPIFGYKGTYDVTGKVYTATKSGTEYYRAPVLPFMPISLTYEAPAPEPPADTVYSQLSSRSYLGNPSNYRSFEILDDIVIGDYQQKGLVVLFGYSNSQSPEGSLLSRILTELDKWEADYASSYIAINADRTYDTLKRELPKYYGYDERGQHSLALPSSMFIFNDETKYIGVNVKALLDSTDNDRTAFSYFAPATADFTAGAIDPDLVDMAVEDYVNVEFELPHSLIDGATKPFAVSIDDNLSEERLVAQVSAVDLFGAAVPVTVESSDYNPAKLGTYHIVLKATDIYGQTARATLVVTVQDRTKPTIVQKDQIRLRVTSTVSAAQLLTHFTITDNVDRVGSGITTSFTLPAGFEFDKALNFGTYSLKLTAVDASGNSASVDFVVTVYDDIAPVITRKEGSVSDPVTVGFSKVSDSNTIPTILSFYKADDAVDGACTVYLKSGTLSTSSVGDNSLIIGAKDKSGNEALLTITVKVSADIPPVFIMSDKLAVATNDTILTLEEIQRLLRAFVQVTSTDLKVTDAKNYLATPTIRGNYTIKYSYVNGGETVDDQMTLRVLSESDISGTDEEPKKPGFWDELADAFKTVFSDKVKDATGAQWAYVVLTIVTGFAALALVVLLLKKLIG